MIANVIVKLSDLDFDDPGIANSLIARVKTILVDYGKVDMLYESRISDIFNIEWRVTPDA